MPADSPSATQTSSPSKITPSRRSVGASLTLLDTVHICAYTIQVAYAWDRRKAEANLAKHGIAFADAVTALEDEFALSKPEPSSISEERFVALGTDALGRLLVVIYSHRGDDIRLISARKAEPKERRQYEELP